MMFRTTQLGRKILVAGALVAFVLFFSTPW